jgi:hypothetical protein
LTDSGPRKLYLSLLTHFELWLYGLLPLPALDQPDRLLSLITLILAYTVRPTWPGASERPSKDALSASMMAEQGPRLRQPPSAGYVCKICNIPGHWIHDCPKKGSGSGRPFQGYCCKICNMPGHWIHDCPQRIARLPKVPNPALLPVAHNASSIIFHTFINALPTIIKAKENTSTREGASLEEGRNMKSFREQNTTASGVDEREDVERLARRSHRCVCVCVYIHTHTRMCVYI